MELGELKAFVTVAAEHSFSSPVSFQSRIDDPIELRVSTVGRVLPHLECKIVDPETGATVPRGTPGELCTRGYAVMLGYWNDDDATAAAIDAARWMHTGDLAVMNDDGSVAVTGRLKDMIIRGGENISPREIEEFLHTHEKVTDVQVIGVPDHKYGEEVCAWIRLRDGGAATEEEFRDFCRGQIATFKIPAVHQIHQRIPDDGHRESSEVKDAGDYRGGAGPRPGDRRGVDLQSRPEETTC